MNHLHVDRLLERVAIDEGKVLNDQGKHVVYKDHLGYETVGYGKLVSPDVAGGGLTEEEAMFLLENTLREFWVELEAAIPWITDKPEEVQEALLNQAYNLGIPNLMKFKNMLKCIEENNGQGAYVNALDSKWADQVGSRATRIAEVYRDYLQD